MRFRSALSFLAPVVLLVGCSSTYYKAWELLGKEKRDLLKSNIRSVNNEQRATQKQFNDALAILRETYQAPETDLSKQYNRLKSEYEASNSHADALKSRITKVHTIAEDLFEEWGKEAHSITNETLKGSSLQKLDETVVAFRELSRELKSSESSLEPVLTSLRDYTLYLKHNLNAQSLASLQDESRQIQEEISRLIAQMEVSTRETERFLLTLN